MAVDGAPGGQIGLRLEELCRAIEGQLGVLAGRRDTVAAAAAELEATAAAFAVRQRLAAAAAGARSDSAASPVVELLARLAGDDPDGVVYPTLLGARSAPIRARSVDLVLGRPATAGCQATLSALAVAVDGDPRRDDPSLLVLLAAVVGGRPELLEPDVPAPLRRMAARVFDRTGEPAPAATAVRVLGAEARTALAPYLEYTRASHGDLVALTPRRPPPCLESLRRAEAVLGRAELGRLLGELGWGRVAWGLEVEGRVGLAVGGGLPLIVSPLESALLAPPLGAEVVWERWLAVGFGSSDGAGTAGSDREAVERFRLANLLHAEVLSELMVMAPLDGRRARRLVAMVRRLAEAFVVLFEGVDDEAARVPSVVAAVVDPLAAAVADVADGDPVPAPVAHRMLAFEDPVRLDDVHGLHGLKRFLHQRSLKAAFRRFRSATGADRTVDLAVWETGRPITVVRRLRYVDLEAGGGDRLPLVVRLAVEAYGRHLLHGLDRLPDLEAFCYGNEVQAYLRYRNHPAFVRVDLAPPLRGGMLDLEYFAVSQYEIDRHPDLELPAIREAFAALDLDLELDGHRLHARYDKERAFDLGQLVARTAEVLCLVPYLMDLDWVVGGLDYPAPARREVARAWAGWLRSWGVVPDERLLTADRRKVLAAVEHDPAGLREVPWDGRGGYRDALGAGLVPAEALERLRARLADLGLAPLERWLDGGPLASGQLPLERAVLEPLREALRSGWLEVGPDGLRQVSGDRARREHEAIVLAGLLAGGGAPLARAAATARLVRQIEPHLRFHTAGAVAGHPVDEARVWLSSGSAGLTVLRDSAGAAALALAFEGSVLVLRRPADGGPWSVVGEIEPCELERRLRHDAYPVPPPGIGDDAAAVADELRRPDARGDGGPEADERAVPGIVAAPGRAVGPVRFGTAGRTPAALDGAVLVAPAVAPADAPYLQHAAAIVSTGGGVLSHAGLVALELGRPSLVVEGHWRTGEGEPQRLLLRREEHRDERRDVAGLEVRCRRGVKVSDEILLDGDLVIVDADLGRLGLLGRDLDARAAWAAVREVQHLGVVLGAGEVDDAAELELRGRLLRAVHQLERLAARISSPDLVRFLIWELLVELPAAAGEPARPGVRRVLTCLLEAPVAGAVARRASEWCVAELGRREEGLLARAFELARTGRTPYEALLGRTAARRVAAARSRAAELAGGVPPTRDPAAGLEALDAEIRARLEAQRDAALGRLAGVADEPASMRPALRRVAVLERVLGPSPQARERAQEVRAGLAAAERAVRTTRRGRRTLAAAELGLDAVAEVGGKAAALGELGSVLGGDLVPSFFAVTQGAFREVLEGPAVDGGAPLADRIRSALGAAGDDPGTASRAVRRLFEEVALPAGLEDEVAARLAAIEGMAGGPVAVAVRSSGLEEDSAVSAWAGQFDTFLGVVGLDEVLRCLRLAWAGLWSERALYRRREPGATADLPGGGVVVQRMVASRVSGVLHTAAVAVGRPDEMVVNVGLGLGEGVVAGTVDVDHVVVAKAGLDGEGSLRFRYVVGDKREQVVADPRRPGETCRRPALAHQRLRPALEYLELEALVRAALRLEDAWGEPLDLEFAFEGPSLRILQARPVPAVHRAVWSALERWPLGGRGAPVDRPPGAAGGRPPAAGSPDLRPRSRPTEDADADGRGPRAPARRITTIRERRSRREP